MLSAGFFVVILILMLAIEKTNPFAFTVGLLVLGVITSRVHTVFSHHELLQFVFDDCDQCSINGTSYGAIHSTSRVSPWWVWLVIEDHTCKQTSLMLCTWKFDEQSARSLNYRILRSLYSQK